MLTDYYKLIKPGIIYGNSLPAIAGFIFALNLAQIAISFTDAIKLFLGMLFGLGLIIASACVFNNIFDADIDLQMDRTKNRAIVLKVISKKAAFIYGSLLLLLGSFLLLTFVNKLAFYIAIFGFISYVFIYTPFKRLTIYSTIIGAIPGAVAPVVGYVAVRNNIDTAAILLFLILFFWQMPHFYAIGIFRQTEYVKANLPIWPIKKGLASTYKQIIFFIFTGLLLTYFKYTGYVFAGVFSLLGFLWLKKTYRKDLLNLPEAQTNIWAKSLFKFSLIVLLVFCVIISIDKYLPI
jgi:protoheme IX farnesyltransferase